MPAVTQVRRLLPFMPTVRIDVNRGCLITTPTRFVDLNRTVQVAELALSMDHASTLTLTVDDPDMDLWRSPALSESMILTIDDPTARYVQEWRLWRSRGVGTIGRSGTSTTLVFWDAGSAALKLKTTPLSRSATSLNWKGWVTLMASEVAGTYRLIPVVPRPNSTPPREEGEDAQTTAGWSAETRKKVTVNGKPASHDQLKNMDISFARAVKEKAPGLAVLAMGCAGTKESGWEAVMNRAGSDYGGVFQGNVKSGLWDLNDTDGMARSFLLGGKGFQGGGAIKLARENSRYSPGRIALIVEGSASNFASFDAGVRFYDTAAREARANIELWSGVDLSQWSKVTGPAGTDDGYGDTGNARPTEWRRGRPNTPESSLKSLSRNAAGLGQRAFVAADRLVAARDQDLILAAPHLAFALDDYTFVAGRPDVQHDGNHLLTQITVPVFAAQWGAPPGSVVEVLEPGQIERTWLVQSVRCPSNSEVAEVVLQQPTTKIPKPPTATKTDEQLTGTAPQVAIKWAISKLDVRELPSGSNNGPEVAKIIVDNGGSVGQPWCGYFCRGALRAAGLTPAVGMAAVQWIYNTSGAKGDVFRGRTSALQARPGDLAILYGTDVHVGLVEKVSGGRVHTIEGNTSTSDGKQGVSRKQHPPSDVVAIAQVKWPADSPSQGGNGGSPSRDAAIRRGGGPRDI
jgi:hypothetical protein